MVKLSKMCLTVLLMIVSVVSTINVIVVMCGVPIFLPLSCFSAIQVLVFAFMAKQYYLIPVSIAICVLLFLTTISAYRRHIVLPVLSCIYLICDFIILLILFIYGLSDGYWTTYFIPIIITSALIVLLCHYCWCWLRIRVRKKD